ncbi:MAG: hypothetical protein WBM99_16450, partial [Psychromonas sp.]
MTCIQNGFAYIGMFLKVIRFHSYAITVTLMGITLVVPTCRLMAYEFNAKLIQSIDTSLFRPSSPDPSGIAYFPSLNPGEDFFLVTDGEVNELNIFENVNVFKVDRNGTLLGTLSTIRCRDNYLPCIDGDNNPLVNPLVPSLAISYSFDPSLP